LGNSTLLKLNDGLPTTLNDNMSSVGHATWALQWDLSIAPNSSPTISEDENVYGVTLVPEPSSLSIAVMAVVGCALMGRKRVAC
jgi:hypothetical protein